MSFITDIAQILVGQVIGHTPAFQKSAKHIQRSMFYAVTAGFLTASFLVFSCYGLSLWLIGEGVSSDAAIMLSGGVLLVFAILGALLGKKHMGQAFRSLNPYPDNKHIGISKDIDVTSIINAFIDGFQEQEEAKDIDELQKKIIELEARLRETTNTQTKERDFILVKND
jgi:hypothetical protein